MAGMEGDEALRGVDCLVIGIALILRIGLHQDGFGGPAGVGVLPLDLAEGFGGGLVGTRLHLVEALIVELGDRSPCSTP